MGDDLEACVVLLYMAPRQGIRDASPKKALKLLWISVGKRQILRLLILACQKPPTMFRKM